jgi:hypothetical protein
LPFAVGGAKTSSIAAATVFYYFAAGPLPHVIFAGVFGVAEALFFVLMGECWLALKTES